VSQSQSSLNPAQVYEEYLVPHQFRPWAGDLLDRADPQVGERVLDVACGTGVVARLVAQRLEGRGHMVGLDFSQAMIDVARQASAQDGVAVEWHLGSAEALPFADASFDLALVQQGLQFMADKAAAVRELHRILVPGGRAVTATWATIDRNPFFVLFGGVLQRHLGTPAVDTLFSLGDRELLRSLFVEAGFDTVGIESVGRTVRFPSLERFIELRVAAGSATVPALKAMDAAGRAALTAAVRADMAAPLQQYIEGDELVFPTEANIAVARKG
jgi:ubiquinone/menaquinone biosynthesis C-methylase UbiE